MNLRTTESVSCAVAAKLSRAFKMACSPALIGLVAMLNLSAAANADDLVYSDSTFNTGDWGFQTVGIGSGSASQVTSGGNPGSYRRITQTVNPFGARFFSFSRYGTTQATRYEPSVQGAIESVDFSIQAQNLSTLHDIYPDLAMGIKQNGLVFVQSQFFSLAATSWQTYSRNDLIPADFTCINGDGGESLDFSTSGSPIRFGFITINRSEDEFTYGGVTEYDNYQVTVHIAPPPCFGDLDGSGEVDGGDIGLVLLDFGPCPGCTTDLDESGEVDGGDIGLVLLSFGSCE